ncbi:SRPBCC domain-containing protein [Sphingomonas sp. M1-B02]|uniref:SRPBCC domain-containing protein n=1 Tax=Sphingomonas sp. M1-B02 TaxID=3114300 RepID=UPI00223F3CA8|nr:SRPBCC domain-containing protein [Sphingomonas sp. S6-11]UZK64649.1 SRPBCC domain-containing protein [Sphingomonas sp. S6-11]
MPAQKITVAAEVPLSPEEAWRVHTDPSEITRWNFANDQWHCPSATTDLQVGGLHKARMEAKDGSFGFDFEGTYTEVDAPRALTVLLGDGRHSRTTFQPSATGTLVETTFDAETDNSVEMQQQGWQAILSNYGKRAEEVAGS